MRQVIHLRTSISIFVCNTVLCSILAAQQQGAEQSPATDVELAGQVDPIVVAIQQSNPTTPAEMVEAAEALLNVGQLEPAKALLRKLLDAQLDINQLAMLHRRLGTGTFIRLLQERALAPEGSEMATTVLAAADRWARDPERVERLVDELLESSSPAARHGALTELRAVPVTAFTPLMQVIAKGETPDQVREAHAALARLGQAIVGPLTAALESPDRTVRMHSIAILRAVRSNEAVPALLQIAMAPQADIGQKNAASDAIKDIVGTAPTLPETEAYFERRIRELLSGRLPSDADLQGNVTLWRWDVDKNEAVSKLHTAKDAAIASAAKSARILKQLQPNRADYRRLYLMTNLELAQRTAGLGKPLPQRPNSIYSIAVEAAADELEQVLGDAIGAQLTAGAIATANILGDVGDIGLLMHGSHERPLVRALRHPDRRLRMAAARAVVKIDPHKPYAGASDLWRLIQYVISTDGTRRALVATPNVDDAHRTAGYLRQLGYAVDTAGTGREATRLALRQPDYEVVLAGDSLDRPPTSELLQHLRQHHNSAQLPIAIMARGQYLVRAENLASYDSLTRAFPRPHDLDSVRTIVQELLSLTQETRIEEDERIDHAVEALQWLTRFTADRDKYNFYELTLLDDSLSAALGVPELAGHASKVISAATGASRATERDR